MRICAYCGHEKCHCSYKRGRAGKRSAQVHNTSTGATAGEMLRSVVDYFSQLPSDMKGAWVVSFTEYDESRVKKAAVKGKRDRRRAFRPSNQISK